MNLTMTFCTFMSFSFSFFSFLLFRAAPAAYGGSQARGWIRGTVAGLYHSHSHARSEPCLWAIPQLTAILGHAVSGWTQQRPHCTQNKRPVSFSCWVDLRYPESCPGGSGAGLVINCLKLQTRSRYLWLSGGTQKEWRIWMIDHSLTALGYVQENGVG